MCLFDTDSLVNIRSDANFGPDIRKMNIKQRFL